MIPTIQHQNKIRVCPDIPQLEALEQEELDDCRLNGSKERKETDRLSSGKSTQNGQNAKHLRLSRHQTELSKQRSFTNRRSFTEDTAGTSIPDSQQEKQRYYAASTKLSQPERSMQCSSIEFDEECPRTSMRRSNCIEGITESKAQLYDKLNQLNRVDTQLAQRKSFTNRNQRSSLSTSAEYSNPCSPKEMRQYFAECKKEIKSERNMRRSSMNALFEEKQPQMNRSRSSTNILCPNDNRSGLADSESEKFDNGAFSGWKTSTKNNGGPKKSLVKNVFKAIRKEIAW